VRTNAFRLHPEHLRRWQRCTPASSGVLCAQRLARANRRKGEQTKAPAALLAAATPRAEVWRFISLTTSFSTIRLANRYHLHTGFTYISRLQLVRWLPSASGLALYLRGFQTGLLPCPADRQRVLSVRDCRFAVGRFAGGLLREAADAV